MSDHLAIGGVSLTLRALLEDRMEFARPGLAPGQRVLITLSAPDVEHENVTGPRLNLFLYHLSENGSLKNQEIPGHGHPGAYGHPPLSLDLYYLMTAYSNTEQNDVLGQQVLGDAMRVLHDFPIITDGLLRERTLGNVPVLDTSLLGEFERVKIALQPLTLEDVSKLWTALPETNFRCSVAYQISVVQIESRRSRPLTLPVRERHLVVFPFEAPRITEVFRDPPLGGIRSPVAQAGEQVSIRGVNLAGTGKRVILRGVTMPMVSQRDDEIVATVPATVPAGAHPLQVVQEMVLSVPPGQPLEAHRAFSSNAVAFLVIPRIVSVNPPAASAGANVTMTVDPAVQATQQAEVLLGDRVLPAALVPANATASPTVQFQLPGAPHALPPGTPLMRVRVDGAESRLDVDPTTQQYNAPRYTII